MKIDRSFQAAQWGQRWFAVAVGVSSFALLYLIGVSVSRSYSSAFFATPFFLGLIVALVSGRNPFRNSLISLMFALITLVVTLREGVLCVLMSLPLSIPLMLLGTFCGAWIRHYLRTRGQKVTTIVVLLLISAGWQTYSGRVDRLSDHPWHTVQTERTMPFAPAEVFSALTGGLRIQRPAPALLRMGFPQPGALTVESPGVGGGVSMAFNHGSARGHIVGWEPGRRFAFRVDRYDLDDPPFFITRMGQGEHYGFKVERVTDWLTLGLLEFKLEPMPGGTRVTRTTTFQRHLFPDFYFGWLEPKVMALGQEHLLAGVEDRLRTARDAPAVATGD